MNEFKIPLGSKYDKQNDMIHFYIGTAVVMAIPREFVKKALDEADKQREQKLILPSNQIVTS